MNAELERFDPAEQRGRIVYEHLHRYALCREYVGGRRVLDLACGIGYGTAILGTAAAQVTGVDISSSAIREARKRYASKSVKFVIGDCYDLPFEDGSFDIVVANEMIEHVEDHQGLLEEVRRVLSPNGVLLVSTPNKPVYNRYKPPNAFHVSEMEVPEFRKLLTDHFKHVRLTGTRMALLSVGYALDPSQEHGAANLAAARIHIATGSSESKPKVDTGELNLTDPEYVLAVCSDAPLEDVAIPSSVFFDEKNDLWLEHEKIMAWASGLHEEDEVLRADVARTRELLEEGRVQTERIETERSDLARRLEEVRDSNSVIAASLESERQALAREAEAIRKEAFARQGTIAELLGRMGSHPVGSDHTAILSSLFEINETLVTERLFRARTEEQNRVLEGRVADLDANANRERERLTAEIAARREELSAEQARREKLEAERAALSEEISLASEALAALRAETAAEQERLSEELAARGGELSSERARREELETERAALAEEIRAASEALAALRAEAAAEQERLSAELAARDGELSSELARREELETERAAAFNALRSEQSRLVELGKRVEELEARLMAAEARDKAAGEASSRITLDAQDGSQSAIAPVPPYPRAPIAPPALAGARRSAPTARSSVALLHRRTLMALASAPAQISGRIGAAKERTPLPWHLRLLGKERTLETSIFSSEWVACQDARLRDVSLKTFLAEPRNRTISPHPLFDSEYYLRLYPDVAESGMSPLVHYVLHGWREGRNPHPLFPNDWYLAQNQDVAAHGQLSPLDHYLVHGWKEGRRPNPLFNPRTYLDRYPDVEAADFEPLSHFMLYGSDEKRELNIEGWQQDLPSPYTHSGPLQFMEMLLRGAVAEVQAPAILQYEQVAGPAPSLWPPAPVDDFWPAQTMREMIAETYGEPLLSRIWYLLSLMNRWQDRQDEFAGSDDCRNLLERLRERAASAAAALLASPSATVIIPIYNNVLDTLLCLASLLELDERHTFDVIVADDGSTDAAAALIATIGGNVRYLRQPRNLGFLGNCNAAATQARGETIVLLNNDTLVFTGWLDGLLDPIAEFPKVGMVGSKLINWDGTLQEAGGIFWRDGSAWNYGRNQDARAPGFNYLKDADYCSGASIAVPAPIWREVGGFDPIYSPAYCEDSDLAFRLREAGYRTLYSPASEVVHHEGRSHGRDVGSGVKAYQVTNNQRLFERWRPVLERDHFANAENVLHARDRSFTKRHVLVIDHYVPQWDRDAGSRTMFDFLQVLVQAGHAVTFWPDNLWRDPEYTPRLQALGIEVIYGPSFFNAFDQFLLDREGLYDMVLLSRPHISVAYIDKVRQRSRARVVYYGHDVHFMRMMAERELAGQPPDDADVLAMKSQELRVCNNSDLVLYPSAEETRLMKELLEPEVEVRTIAAYRYDKEELAAARAAIFARPKDRDPLNLLFVGGFAHSPNVDAVTWFCRSVMPLLRHACRPRLQIAGSHPTGEVLSLRDTDIDVLGFVSSDRLLSLYREAHVTIAPLRFGAGVKGKVIEAMARGCPVVTTSVGAQGIEGAANLMFIGDTAEEFATQIQRAADAEAGQRCALASLSYVEWHYTAEAMAEVFQIGFGGSHTALGGGR